jgi:hypothetical protein
MALDEDLEGSNLQDYRRAKAKEYPADHYVVFVGREVYAHGPDVNEMLNKCTEARGENKRYPVIVSPDGREPKRRPIVRGRSVIKSNR